jgi:hypothetical protein
MFVSSQKNQKIDLNSEYPCPCKRKGRLLPIILTEAFGCNRCQQIFVLEENGRIIEQLSSSYPYKKAWRWTGYRWTIVHRRLRESPLGILLISVILLMIIFSIIWHSPVGISIILWAILVILLIILPALAVWWLYRR